MKRIVLIDGENFSRGIRNLAGSVAAPAARDMLATFSFRQLIDDVLGDGQKAQVLYFGARLRRYTQDSEILQQSEDAIRLQARLVNSLQTQGISFVKVGYLRARETKQCPSCGHSKWQLLEKGVDVGLAVRMVAEAGVGTELVLCSSDTDLLPAVKLATRLGSSVLFIGYEYQPVLALAKEATATRLITKQMVEEVLHGK